MRQRGGLRHDVPAFALLFLVYTLMAVAGLRWASIAGVASPIWPAAGVALAGLLLGGQRLFPAIILGVLVAGFVTGTSHVWWVQLLLALGKAAAAVAATSLIRRFASRHFTQLATVRDVLMLIAAAVVSSAISAAVGGAALLAANRLTMAAASAATTGWFFGDAVGILILTALIVTSVAGTPLDRRLDGWRLLQFAGALLAVAGLCVVVFFSSPLARAWAVYPALGWVALSFRSRGAAVGLLIVFVLASAGTLLGTGPFAHSALDPDLLLLQQFLVVTAATTLLLAAAVDERDRESRLYRTAADELSARRELQRTTSLLTMIGNAAPSFIYAKDRDGRFIYANRALLEVYGRPLADVLGRTDRDFSALAEADAFIANDRRIMASGQPSELEEMLTVDGQARIYFSVKAPLRDINDEIAGIVGISTDITDRRQHEDELKRLTRRAEIAQRAARSSLYEYELASGVVTRDPTLAELCGLQPSELGSTRDGWERHIHPEDLADFRSTVARAIAGAQRYALEYRVIGEGGRVSWVSDAGQILRDEEGDPLQVIGLVTDITAQKSAEEREQLLAREVDHRAKNLLAVVQSVVQLTRAEDSVQLKEGITGRIQSLARAHSLLADARWQGVELAELAAEELAPFGEGGEERITIEGPRLLLKPAAAQSLALVLHELATNAVKYGALSTAQGRLDLSWSEAASAGGGMTLIWRERAGPPSRDTAPSQSGFGSKVIKASIERQLRGSLVYDWAREGLTVTMSISRDYVALAAPRDPADAPS